MVGTLMFCCTSGLLYFYLSMGNKSFEPPLLFCIPTAISNDGQIIWAITTERPKCQDHEEVKTRSLLTLYFWGEIDGFRLCCMALKKFSYLSQIVSVNTIIINNNTVELLQILSPLGASKGTALSKGTTLLLPMRNTDCSTKYVFMQSFSQFVCTQNHGAPSRF